jgi:uncharacterized 2Fe-2S/4Fe-4S cluster protein (DUF4445 family)
MKSIATPAGFDHQRPRDAPATHRVTLQPDSRSVEVRHGERLLGAAWKTGVGIKSVCGGRGKCGSCIVEIDAAEAGALSLPGEGESDLLPPHPGGGTYRLACLCEVQGDVTISVPPESQAVRSAPRKPHTVTAVAARPLACRVTLTVEGPNAAPPRSLATRIKEAAATALGQKSVELALPVMTDYTLQRGFDAVRELTATVYRERQLIQLLPGRRERSCGLAVDIGTTSFVVFLCDLVRGEILAMRTAGNPQAIFGEDVISRMTHIQQDAGTLQTMRGLLVDDINRLAADACQECGVAADDIVDAVLVGNPTMQHILLGLNPEPLGRGPYLPVWSDGVNIEARELGLAIAPHARAFVFPMVSGYIGGDTLAALLTRGPEFYRGTHLLVDVGTNGEVVLAHDGRLFATSCATGPVYEGAHIRCGVRAAPGAIERVWMDDRGAIRWAAIPGEQAKGDKRPIGLCGSGVISSVAAAVGAGLIGSDGALAPTASHRQLRANGAGRSEELVLVDGAYARTGRDIVLTQHDVRAVQLGKSALRAGIEMLLDHGGVKRLDHIYLAGTFGNHLQPEDILAIGLVPPLPVRRIRSIGNAAGDGARMALFNRHHRQRVTSLARRLDVLELSGRAEFQDLFLAHTELAPGASEITAGSRSET